MMLNLTPSQRRFLRAQAHALHPIVMIGDAGLSAGVLKEIANSIKAHELIKIKVMNEDRDEREAMLAQICETQNAAPVQHLGKILIIYKPAEKPKLKLPR